MRRYCLKDYIPKELEVSGVYMIQIASHIYIGSSKNIRTRIVCHRKMLREQRHVVNMQSQYNKYGESELYASVLEICDESVRLQREEFWIKALSPDMNRDKKPTRKPIYEPWNNPGISKTVYRYKLSGEYLDSFPSVKEAQRQLEVKSSVLIAAAANPNNKTFKSAYGYLWSYTKVDNMPAYENHSKDSKKVSVIIKNIETNEEFEFQSIAEAVRTLFPNTDKFNSLCATISSCAGGKGKRVNKIYTARYKR